MDSKVLIEKALTSGFSDFEVYSSKSTSTTLSIFNGEVVLLRIVKVIPCFPRKLKFVFTVTFFSEIACSK